MGTTHSRHHPAAVSNPNQIQYLEYLASYAILCILLKMMNGAILIRLNQSLDTYLNN